MLILKVYIIIIIIYIILFIVNKYIKILCTELLENNKLGPILFVTPELGRWSTVGGLGIYYNIFLISIY